MKNIKMTTAALGVATTLIISGCAVYVGNPPPPEPEPVVEVVPTAYVWDGYEYVGEVNGGWYWFGPHGWVVCDGVVLGRFHGWERYHSDWRAHMIINNRDHRLDRAHVERAHAERAHVESEHRAGPAPHPQHAPQHAPPSKKQKDDKNGH
jgi:hypothetical protein